MLCVPIKGDEIKTSDGHEFVVLSYTNFKDKRASCLCAK